MSQASTANKAPARVPVVLVTGYLGSGKTTLISSLLSAEDMAGTSVIVNELAEAGIDQAIIADQSDGDVVLLSNGCLCCGSGSDLRQAVARLLSHEANRKNPTRRIIIETSGAADPGPIIQQVCFDPVLRNRVRYGGTLTLFDALHGTVMLGRDPVGYRQLGLADRILVTKRDLASPRQSLDAEALVRAANPNATLVASPADLRDYLLAGGRSVTETGVSAWIGSVASPYGDTAAHNQPLRTWTIVGSTPLDWQRTEHFIRSAFDTDGADVLRTKGIVWTADDDRPLVVHGINRQFHRPVRLSGWEGARETRFVLIGFERAGNVARKIADAIGGRISSDGRPGHSADRLKQEGVHHHVQAVGK